MEASREIPCPISSLSAGGFFNFSICMGKEAAVPNFHRALQLFGAVRMANFDYFGVDQKIPMKRFVMSRCADLNRRVLASFQPKPTNQKRV
jgi:hypothetical protein